ncbi:hypothetical protein K2173_014961 [Erythroxylum novogranatense]|uniref:Nudix hydrolase domain-containing protein n=1 Tax=Erythroxylum novogranatense TaxID=1862640 RepID=A0AAV8TTQ5_9ROSI|nr:hypothetical protein K2173_014961 [Erythroxylum novogranatense]
MACAICCNYSGEKLGIKLDGCLSVAIENDDDTSDSVVELLMINSNTGPGLLFPKGGWENDEAVEEAAAREALEEAGVRGDLMHFLGHYEFKSCKASMFALLVKEELESWPEQSMRQRSWLTIREAQECCRNKWMRDALVEDFTKWHDDQMIFHEWNAVVFNPILNAWKS